LKAENPLMPVRARPISPHLQIYRWQIGNTLSILHRFTGVGLSIGFLALAYWFVAISGDAAGFGVAAHLFSSPVGLIAMLAWSFAFFYHLLNGVRHLFWDAGYGFGRAERHGSGWLAVGGAALLTFGAWALLWHFGRL
jgi:succinate dehydrogenase / fumarate reductase cytochrome b subunit